MALPRKEGFRDGDRAEGSDRQDQPLGSDAPEESGAIGGSGSSGPSDTARRSTGISAGLTERLRDVLRGESDGDLLVERSDVENGVLQWLRALDLQVLGACRADERLKPLLKLNVSSGLAEERLMVHLNQHFEASEVGMLARCLCIPLVSIRVGKINKQGNLLCPTSTRGHLNLSLLPSSNMRISFTGDDGCIERLAVVANDPESSAVTIEEISADISGRSFLLKLPGSQVSYFWCSEKSQLHGMELIAKMKDVLRKKPSLSHLAGICESRLDSFANHLRAYLLGSSNTPKSTSAASLVVASNLHASDSDFDSSSKPSRVRLTAAHTAKGHPFYQGSLSPRSNTFKDGILKSTLSNRNGAREKHRRRGDGCSSLLTIDNQPVTSSSATCTTYALSTSQCEEDNLVSSVSSSGLWCSMPCCLPEIPCLSSPLSSCSQSVITTHPSQLTIPSPVISPYYCWCPPCPSQLQYTVSSSHLPIISTESLRLPPLSSLLSSEGPPVSIIPSELPIVVAELPSLNIPSLFPGALVRFPLPVSSRVTLSSSQQIPIFTPFMSDPIVHIPIIDVCSAGQGYLVSAEPAISSAIAPLLPTRASPLVPETDSVVEKSARETLRMLMASAPISTSPQLMTMLPQVLNSSNNNFPCAHVIKHGTVVSGSRCLYSGTLDVKAVTSVSFMGSPLSRQKLAHGSSITRDKQGDLEAMDPSKSPQVSEGSACAKEDDLLDQQASD